MGLKEDDAVSLLVCPVVSLCSWVSTDCTTFSGSELCVRTESCGWLGSSVRSVSEPLAAVGVLSRVSLVFFGLRLGTRRGAVSGSMRAGEDGAPPAASFLLCARVFTPSGIVAIGVPEGRL